MPHPEERLGELRRRLSALEEERGRLLNAIRQLETAERPSQCAPVRPLTSAEKVRLFRSLFRGREDVYARLWVSGEKKGYTPTCVRQWQSGCPKPRVPGHRCDHRELAPVTNAVIRDHLTGRHTIGIYPLQTDDTCWFLAADFDKQSWQEDAGAFWETCHQFGVPATLERSRSGLGGHVWVFFDAPVAAAKARQMGSFLLTETITRHGGPSLASYDRLFPNQDTLPAGGFGNLIALPLQHGPRQTGNTLFLNPSLQPIADPWEYLANLQRMSPELVQRYAREAEARGRILAVPDLEDGNAPWEPRRRPNPLPHSSGPLPARIQAVLAGELFVEREGLGRTLEAAIRRLAASPNPEFYRKQKMRFSTANTPRIVPCARDFPRHLALPRGCLEPLQDLLAEAGIPLDLADERQAGTPLQVGFQGRLTDIQEEAVAALREHHSGILSAPPGSGKTVMAAYLLAERGTSTIILVPTRNLLGQWRDRLAEFLDVPRKEIGQIGGGRNRPTGNLDVATIQSLAEADDPVFFPYGHLIVDECHHVAAYQFEEAVRRFRPRYVLGLTATPFRRDGLTPILTMHLGSVRYAIREDGRQTSFLRRVIRRNTAFEPPPAPEGGMPIQQIYTHLATDEARNRIILEDLLTAVEQGRNPILL